MRTVRFGFLGDSRKQGPPSTGAGEGEISAIPHWRIADPLYVFSTRTDGSDREDEDIALHEEAQCPVC